MEVVAKPTSKAPPKLRLENRNSHSEVANFSQSTGLFSTDGTTIPLWEIPTAFPASVMFLNMFITPSKQP